MSMEETTMFDFAHFYESIAALMPSPCVVVEIGVAKGDSALFLAKELQERNKDFKLYMVDDLSYGGVLQLKQIYENIIESGLGHRIEVIPFGSIKASKMFNGNSIDFCFLDSSHQYKESRQSIKAWYPLLKDDSIFAGHDFHSYEPVRKAVEELLPYRLKRKTIDQPDHFQEFDEKDFLTVEETTNGNGIWKITKNFYFKP